MQVQELPRQTHLILTALSDQEEYHKIVIVIIVCVYFKFEWSSLDRIFY